MRFIARGRLALQALFAIALTLALVECGAAALIFGGRLPARVPTYEFPRAQAPFFVDIDPRFGAWHPPNRTLEHRRACFATHYRSNSYGALDIERTRTAQGPRTIVLGDSFTTGHGVLEADRFSNRLERLTGIPHLNFGAGGTSTIQYFMVYEHLARGFAHDRVLVAVLPDNDFDEGPNTVRYRPYWQGEYPSYTLRYSKAGVEGSMHHPARHPVGITAHDVLGSFSFFYNAADWVAGYRKVMHRLPDKPNYSGYFDFTPEQFQRMRYSLERLHALAPDGRLTVMAIPRLIDLARFQEERANPFGAAMASAARAVGFDFVDMLPLMAEGFAGRERELYLGCDGHWSPVGHDVAAKTLRARMYPLTPAPARPVPASSPASAPASASRAVR